VLLLTHVNYKTAWVHDLTGLTRAAHAAGALTVWDLSHSIGAMPLDVHAAEVDFAVGCTYKYLNGGPGAPAFTFVAERLADRVRQPLSGWMGHARPFDFMAGYEPASGAKHFLTGTPQILSLAALSEALRVWESVDMAAVRRKSVALTSLFIDRLEQECAGFGLRLASPRDAGRRGSHVAFALAHGYPVMRALAERDVIGDFRAPDLMRFGFAPLYTSLEEVQEAVRILKDILETQAWRAPRFAERLAVT
jgi:kynureninase